jgi:hypothetical protein
VLSVVTYRITPVVLSPSIIESYIMLHRAAASLLRPKTPRSLVLFASAPKSFAAAAAATSTTSTEQKRPFWATTPSAQEPEDEEVKGIVQEEVKQVKKKAAKKVPKEGGANEEEGEKKTFNMMQLIKTVAVTHKLSQAESRRIVNTIFDTIAKVRTPFLW